MRILMIADPFVPVPPVTYGGSERDVDIQCRGLLERGYSVHLLAGPGSKNYGGRLTVHHAPNSALASRAVRKIWFQFLSLRHAAKADVIVNHGRLDYLEAVYRTKKPVIHWFHTPLTGREVSYVLSRRRSGDTFVALSRSHCAEDSHARRFKVVFNPVELSTIPYYAQPLQPSYLLFLGRAISSKGVHLAIEVAKRTGKKLVIGGILPNEPGAAAFFEQVIKPQLGPNCEWVGPYDNEKRARLLAGASALLFPIQAPEAFGLVMVEAMAAGVPVIAWRRASTPEVVEEGKTGFLCDSVDEMEVAVGQIGLIDRAECRRSMERRFSVASHLDRLELLLKEAHLKS